VRSAVTAIAFALQATNAQTSPGPDTVTVGRALAAVRTFQSLWRNQWTAGLPQQQRRLNRIQGPIPRFSLATNITVDPRAADLACSFYGPNAAPDHAWGVSPKERKIPSRTNDRVWMCPNWLPPDDYYLSQPLLPDERESIDNALEPAFRPLVVNERRALIRELSAAVSLVPSDSVLVGQYVRMLVDNREMEGALNAVKRCGASRGWCHALEGFVLHRMGRTAQSDAAFHASLASQSDVERCEFTRIGALLQLETRKVYEKLSCAGQDSVNQRVWWLADPLWTVDGNDRLTEQFARRVMIALHAALGRDERYNWTPMGGGDALAEMIERYGWMSYANSGGITRSVMFPSVARGPYGGFPKHLEEKLAARQLGGFKTTYEYSLGRVHVVPPSSMVERPFDISNDDWSLNAPSGTSWDHTFNWWPEEHYAPVHPLIKLREQQTAFLRRQDNALLAFSTALANTDIERKLGDSVDAAIAVSDGPSSIDVVERKRLGAQDRLTFLSRLPDAPALVSVEVPWNSDGERGARSRFGIKPPPPLSRMRAGEVAISDPVILSVPAGATALPNLADSVISLMHGSTTLAPGANEIGVYWETYGVSPGDTVEVTVGIRREGAASIVDRVTSAVGVGSASSLVSASWTEPQPGHAVRNVAGAIPIQMRSVVLDIRAVPIGTYVLEVSVRRRGGATARSSREFTIR
jgi:hypothetical protein